MRVGQIELPANKIFFVGDLSKASEHIPALGMAGFVPSEFLPDLPSVSFGGRLLKTFNNARTLYEREEDLCAINERRAGYNYVHNVRGRSGFISVSQVKPKPDRSQLWPYEGNGKWYDAARYTLRFHCQPVQMYNSLEMDTGYNWIAVPTGATWSGGDGGYRNVSTEDGIVTLVGSNGHSVSSDLVGNDCANGEVRCYDGSTQVYFSGHLFTGNLTISNGLYKVILSANTFSIYYWNSTAYTKIDDFICEQFSRWWLTSCTPDRIEAKTSSGVVLELERGRVPHVYSPGIIACGTLTPSDQNTSTGINYLSLGTKLYVAGNMSFSIATNIIDAGHRWIYFDSVGTQAQQGKDALMISNLSRQVVER